jgi:hypothetical protein
VQNSPFQGRRTSPRSAHCKSGNGRSYAHFFAVRIWERAFIRPLFVIRITGTTRIGTSSPFNYEFHRERRAPVSTATGRNPTEITGGEALFGQRACIYQRVLACTRARARSHRWRAAKVVVVVASPPLSSGRDRSSRPWRPRSSLQRRDSCMDSLDHSVSGSPTSTGQSGGRGIRTLEEHAPLAVFKFTHARPSTCSSVTQGTHRCGRRLLFLCDCGVLSGLVVSSP